MTKRLFRFGPFELHPDQRLLLKDGVRVKLGSRAFALLLTLLERPGQIIGHDHLIAAVWPGTFVEESSLRVHVAALRKALAEDSVAPQFIKNIPGRGYCFIGSLAGEPAAPKDTPEEVGAAARRPLPPVSGRVIGRDDTIASIAAALTEHALVTIVGPGGIGKTTVALSAALAVERQFADGAVFVDLSTIPDEQAVPRAVAVALGLALRSSDPVAELAKSVRNGYGLVVLDNCEHVIEMVATLVEAFVAAPGIRVLATSREPLRAAGEWVKRLPSLDVPPPSSSYPTAREAMRFAAVELFVERASSRLGGYVLTDADAPAVIEICRKVDGIALAIELAAGRVDTIGIQSLAGSVDDYLRILTQGRRTALPRHQTLRATIDWSHELLPATERRVFRRLAAFCGPFTLAGARAVASCKCVSAAEVDECVGNLVAKSLLAVDQQSAPPRYRLLAITRAYAEEKLAEDGEADVAARQHAAYARSVFEQAQAEWESRSTKAWLSDYVGQLPDLHAALEWAFAGTGDAQTGIALTVAAVPLWLELSQVDECLVWVQRALAVVDAAPDAYRRERMQLHAALGFPRMRAVWGRPGGAEAWRVTLSLAEELGDLDYQQRALWALWVAEMNRGEPTASLELADRFCRLETDTDVAVEQRIGARLRARSLHLLGRQDEARLEIDSMLGRYVAPGHRSHVARFQYDQRMVARANLGRIMWVQGHPEQAMQQMEDIVAEASASGHVLTLTHVLSDGACPVALLAGDLAAAERFTTMLEHNTQAHALDVWHAYAGCYRGELQIRGGDPKAGIARLRDALVTLQGSSFVLFRTAFLFALAQGLAAMDRITEGLAVVDDALDQCRRTREAWCVPELMRVRARLLLRQGDRHAAESWLRLSLQQASQQNALSWALRTAVDLSRLRHDQGAVVDAIAVLAPIQARLTEGFGLPDGAAASALLAELRGLTSACDNTSQHNFAPIHSR